MTTFDNLPLFRAADQATSRAGAADVRLRLGSQQAQLLAAYAENPNGLTDEQAGYATGLAHNRSCCYWKRCSELRHKGFLRDTGRVLEASSGSLQMVCEITKAGLAEWDRLRMEQARKVAK